MLRKSGTGTTTGGTNYVGYLTTAENSSLVLSYNLAVGGATIDNDLVSSYADDLVTQVGWFEEQYGDKPDSASWTAESAVFSFWIGINEYVLSKSCCERANDGWSMCSIGNSFYNQDANTFTPKLIDRVASLVQKIYDLGGRKFLFLNVPPTGRSPFFLEQGNATVQQHAAYLDVYNKNLKSMVDGFKANHTDVSSSRHVSHAFRGERKLTGPRTGHHCPL